MPAPLTYQKKKRVAINRFVEGKPIDRCGTSISSAKNIEREVEKGLWDDELNEQPKYRDIWMVARYCRTGGCEPASLKEAIPTHRVIAQMGLDPSESLDASLWLRGLGPRREEYVSAYRRLSELEQTTGMPWEQVKADVSRRKDERDRIVSEIEKGKEELGRIRRDIETNREKMDAYEQCQRAWEGIGIDPTTDQGAEEVRGTIAYVGQMRAKGLGEDALALVAGGMEEEGMPPEEASKTITRLLTRYGGISQAIDQAEKELDKLESAKSKLEGYTEERKRERDRIKKEISSLENRRDYLKDFIDKATIARDISSLRTEKRRTREAYEEMANKKEELDAECERKEGELLLSDALMSFMKSGVMPPLLRSTFLNIAESTAMEGMRGALLGISQSPQQVVERTFNPPTVKTLREGMLELCTEIAGGAGAIKNEFVLRSDYNRVVGQRNDLTIKLATTEAERGRLAREAQQQVQGLVTLRNTQQERERLASEVEQLRTVEDENMRLRAGLERAENEANSYREGHCRYWSFLKAVRNEPLTDEEAARLEMMCKELNNIKDAEEAWERTMNAVGENLAPIILWGIGRIQQWRSRRATRSGQMPKLAAEPSRTIVQSQSSRIQQTKIKQEAQQSPTSPSIDNWCSLIAAPCFFLMGSCACCIRACTSLLGIK